MRRIVESLLVAGALALALAPAHGEDYPSRRITLIAPWPPAGAIDTTCRELAPGVGNLLGQPVVVENRPGAGSTIGTADGAKAAPDGYTLVLAGSGSLAISPTLYKELSYDPRKDFTPIALVVRVPFILVVNPSLPIESVADLINYAKAHPGALTYGSGGAGSPHQLFAEMFKTMTGIEMTHVPYKGSAPALTDVVGGHIASLFADPAPALPLSASAWCDFGRAVAGGARYPAAGAKRRARFRCDGVGNGGCAGAYPRDDCEEVVRRIPHGAIAFRGARPSDIPRSDATDQPATGSFAKLYR
jgi:tripartite-type tricarboxylate transporter receptor subunit TctC